jgi:hypothetical protein
MYNVIKYGYQQKKYEIFVVILNLIKIGSYSVLRSPQHLTEPH